MVGRSAIAGILLSVSITFLVISRLPQAKESRTILKSAEECMPCSTGSEDMCHAGCLTSAGIRARLLSVKTLQEQLSALKHSTKAKAPTISLASLPTETKDVRHLSIETAKREIARENAELLHLGTKNTGGLGQILNSAQKNLLRAEAAEVRLRRQAGLDKGKKQTIMDVFQHLSPQDKRLFRLRAREFELALHQAERSIVTSEDAVKDIADTDLPGDPRAARGSPARMQSMAELPRMLRRRRIAAAARAHLAAPSWTTAMSQTIGSLVRDGSGSAWGVQARPAAKAAGGGKALPGVLEDNWTLDKGALAGRPHGDFAKLPGVKAFGW